ncbi:MAG: hypothetical protein E6I90_15165 [Chloroflexi bacterium]|nr:MAG: hypothetical protein E6I90_15165 [Chloroflexota bacterium]
MLWFANTFHPRRAVAVWGHSEKGAGRRAVLSVFALCFVLLFLGACNAPSNTAAGSHQLAVQQAPKARLTFPVALDAHPNLVTVWLAVNDLADDVPLDSYAHDLDLLLSRLQRGAPHARIAVANVPDLTLVPYFSAEDPLPLLARVQAYNATIASIVKRHHAILVDLYQQWHELRDHPEYISEDGLHPSTLGYTRIAAIFHQILG